MPERGGGGVGIVTSMTGQCPNGKALCRAGLDLLTLEVLDLVGPPLGGPDLEGPTSEGPGQDALGFGLMCQERYSASEANLK